MSTRASIRVTPLKSLAAVLVATSLCSCTVGPDFKRPEVTPPQVFKSQVGPSEANSLADLPWWSVFNDKALQGLVAQALVNNYDLEVAVARIDQARALVGVAEADFYPQIGYQGFAAREKSFVPVEGAGGNIIYNDFGALLSAAWELDVWGRIRRSTEAARARLFAQEDIRRGVMLTLVTDVGAGYFRLIELDRELAIAQESARTYKDTLDLFTFRFEAGKDTKLPVVRAQAAYESSNASMASLKRSIDQQENALSVLLGAYPQAIKRGVSLADQTMPVTPVGLTTDILKRRPDIQQAEQIMVSANAEVGVAVANFYPVVGLSALFGAESFKVDKLFHSDFNIWNIVGSVGGPIFQGGRLSENLHAQQAFWDESIAQYKKTILGAFQETSDALIARQTLVNQRVALEGQVRSLRESVDLSLERYRAGRASYFEVLDAEQLLYPTENALAVTQQDQLIAVVNLYKALGGGWDLKDADWAQPQPDAQGPVRSSASAPITKS